MAIIGERLNIQKQTRIFSQNVKLIVFQKNFAGKDISYGSVRVFDERIPRIGLGRRELG